MKKLIAFTLCAVMTLSFTSCLNNKPYGKDSSQKKISNVEMVNPWIDCETLADAEKLAGFTVIPPKTIEDGFTQKYIQAVKNDIVQIGYKIGENSIVFRQARGSDDISGDFTEYKENNTLSIGSMNVSVKGNSGKINVATWTKNEYTFSISVNPGGNGLDNESIKDMISSMYTN